MAEVSEEQIRVHAYRLWEKANNPEGTPDDFWHQAKSELENDAFPVDENPKPMPE